MTLPAGVGPTPVKYYCFHTVDLEGLGESLDDHPHTVVQGRVSFRNNWMIDSLVRKICEVVLHQR